MPPEAHYDLANLDLNNVLADREAIRRYNPQRFEMEQLDAIVVVDTENQIVVGYKDVHPDEFWVRGHLPNHPLLPGVLICEASAQLCAFYVAKNNLLPSDGFLAFGGLEDVRFRSVVRPGDRLVLVAKAIKLHRRQTIFKVQGFVGPAMVFHADVIGFLMQKAEI